MSVFQDAPGTPGTLATGTAGVGQGGYLCSGVRQDSLDSAIRFCTPKPVHVPSPEAEAHCSHKSQLQGGSQNPPKSPKGPAVCLRTHLRVLKETPDSRLVRSGELLCLGLPTQDMMDSMVLQDSYTAAAAG